jgi:hypothetical protein
MEDMAPHPLDSRGKGADAIGALDGHEQDVRPASEDSTWRIWPATRSMGYWLVHWREDLSLYALAPPGVALCEEFASRPLRQWRGAGWHSLADFGNGRLPTSPLTELSLAQALEQVPDRFTSWMAHVTEHHASALQRTVELAEWAGDETLCSEAPIFQALAQTQLAEAAKITRESDEEPFEWAHQQQPLEWHTSTSLVRRMWDLPLITRSPSELSDEFDAAANWLGLDNLEQLLLVLYWDARRDLEVVKRSKSWRWTRRLRTVKRYIDRLRHRPLARLTIVHPYQGPDWLHVHHELSRARSLRDTADKVQFAAPEETPLPQT